MINLNEQYNGGSLPDIFMLAQAPHVAWLDGFNIEYYYDLFDYVLYCKNKKKMPNGWRTINSLVHKIRLHGRRGKGMAESFSRQKSRQAPQKEGGLKILCDLPPV